MVTPSSRRAIPFSRVARELHVGDVLLFRPRSAPGWRKLDPRTWKGAAIGAAITAHGRSRYCHAALYAELRHRPVALEMVEGVGGRVKLLARYLRTHGGLIDAYRVAPPKTFGRDGPIGYYGPTAADRMLDLVEHPYGYGAVLAAFGLRLPGLRKLVRGFDDDLSNSDDGGWPPFCSAAVADAVRHGGVDLVPNAADKVTEPGDLGRSALLTYVGTLAGPAPIAKRAAKGARR
ncbi:MAG: hypothetical protein AAF805_02105 [Planctomycetota bacterium]